MMKHVTSVLRFRAAIISLAAACVLGLFVGPGQCHPVKFSDAKGGTVKVLQSPRRAVSLVPGITEVLVKIGAADALAGITYHSAALPGATGKTVVGGFYAPSIDAIQALKPDIIFAADLHEAVQKRFAASRTQVVVLENSSISQALGNIRLLGRIFDRELEAAGLISAIRGQLKTVGAKVARIPAADRKRVVRLMGHESVMAPGDDSFQNDFIRAAGGIPPVWSKNGQIVPVTLRQWQSFNPQVIYSCGKKQEPLRRLLQRPGWREVAAVKNKAVYFFPCDQTCRASSGIGDFVGALAAKVYGREFSDKAAQVTEDRVFDSRSLKLDLEYVAEARIALSTIQDFVHKTLIIDFTKPQGVVSTLEGHRRGIKSVGNHFLPPPSWGLGHVQGVAALRARVCKVLDRPEKSAGFLFTGADMDNLAVRQQQYRDMRVYALVTAGVRSNALRSSVDSGNFYEPGTINVILLTNMRLSARAMTRAIVTATEAKTAALADLDVRSSYSPRRHQATGTGTDNVLVVEGDGVLLDNAGGHTKLGELIAKAVYEGVREAVGRQNGLVGRRSVFQRLLERDIRLKGLVDNDRCGYARQGGDPAAALEKLLLTPRYGGFVEAALAMSDTVEQGVAGDLSAYREWCRAVADEIAGRAKGRQDDLLAVDGLPEALGMALNALADGVCRRSPQAEKR